MAISEPGAPESLIAKFPHPDPETRTNFVGAYAHEHLFYTKLAATCPIPTPSLYAAVNDGLAGMTVLLLEDLGHLRGGDDVAGCSDADAFVVATHMARLHAEWWNSPALDQVDWLYSYAKHADGAQDAYQEALRRYLQKVAGIAPTPVLDLVTRYADSVADVRRRLGTDPCTYAHGDFRLDNLFFGKNADDFPLTMGDWQGGTRSRGIVDLSWFAGTGLRTNQRRAIESALVERYHAALIAHGVRGYGLAQCRAEYWLALLNDLVIFVLAVSSLDFTAARAGAPAHQFWAMDRPDRRSPALRTPDRRSRPLTLEEIARAAERIVGAGAYHGRERIWPNGLVGPTPPTKGE